MYRYLILLLLISFGVNSHQFTPTYPVLEQSHMRSVLKVKMQILNKREDVSYYELEVFDAQMKSVAFAATQKIVEVEYLKRKNLEIYIRSRDKNRATYVCSRSKILSGQKKASAISSKICSKILK